MDYIELSILIDAEFGEILIAELAELGFDSFTENEEGIMAYVNEDLFNDLEVKRMIENYASKTSISYEIKKIEKQNWNNEWESNFSPITVNEDIYIRATFHEPSTIKYIHEIIITPKMSFGTGHHETTSQVMELQLSVDHKNKKVLDVGTGTGILAILASKLGAAECHGFDIDEWSVENTLENIQLNDTRNVTVNQGTINTQTKILYDIILANINRNILLNEIPIYTDFMIDGGYLFVSGFYENDVEDILKITKESNLKIIKKISKNNWAAIVFKKQK